MKLENQAKNQIEFIHKQCEKNGIQTFPIEKKDYNFEFVAQNANDKIKIQIYFGKKGIKKILQGNLNSGLYRKINELILEEPLLDLIQIPTDEPQEYIGSDECGKGDFFGPLVTAAVYVKHETQNKLKILGVRDSKDLTETQIAVLAKSIKHVITDDYEIVKINPIKYNQLYDQFKNLNKLLNWAHSKAIDTLLQKTNCKTVITDKFSNKDLAVTSNINHSSVEFIQEPRAERFTGVAAASILARNELNHWFNHHKKLGYNFPKGSSEAVEQAASKLLKETDEDKIGEFVKLHFKTYKKIIQK